MVTEGSNGVTVGKIGRPCVVDAAAQALLCGVVGEGLSLDAAARAIGVKPSTVRSFRRRNPEFAARIDAAKGAVECRLVGCLLRAAETDWRAAAYILARRFNKDWGRDADIYELPLTKDQRETNRMVGRHPDHRR